APTEGAGTVAGPAGAAQAEEKKEPRVPKDAGINRFVWNMRHPDATKIEDDPSMEEFERALAGPIGGPGRYQVRLTVGGESLSAPLEVRLDPRVSVEQRDLQEQFDLLLGIRDKISEAHDAINVIRGVRRQVEDLERRTSGDRSLRSVTKAGAALRRSLTAIEEELIQTKARSRQDTLNWPIKLNAKLGGLAAAVAQADARPTASQRQVFADLSRRVDAQLARLRTLMDRDVAAFTAMVRRAKVPPISPPKRAEQRERKAAAARAS
ncbi:MAG: glycosyl hydrolase, partial [Chloroflexota bacterium]